MDRKKYQSIQAIQPTVFDNVAYAERELKSCKLKLKIGTIATLAAVPYTLLILITLFGISATGPTLTTIMNVIGVISAVGMLAGIIAGVLFTGLLGIAFRLVKKVTFWCWALIPVMPADLAMALIGGVMTAVTIIIVPALYLAISVYGVYQEKRDAEEFLALAVTAPTKSN